MRSCLILRADEDMDFEAALGSGAQALLLELGAAVDESGRSRARERARDFLEKARIAAARPLLFVRIAPATDETCDADLEALIPAAPDGVFLEKAEGRVSVQHLSVKLSIWEAEAGLPDGTTKITAFAAQTPAAIFGLGTYAGASRRLVGLAFDAEALRVAMERSPSPHLWGEGRGERHGVSPTMLFTAAIPLMSATFGPGPPAPHPDPLPASGERETSFASPLAIARSLLVLGAAAAGVPAIDGPFLDTEDEAAFAADCRAARRDGFVGKMAVRLEQVVAINAAYSDLP